MTPVLLKFVTDYVEKNGAQSVVRKAGRKGSVAPLRSLRWMCSR